MDRETIKAKLYVLNSFNYKQINKQTINKIVDNIEQCDYYDYIRKVTFILRKEIDLVSATFNNVNKLCNDIFVMRVSLQYYISNSNLNQNQYELISKLLNMLVSKYSRMIRYRQQLSRNKPISLDDLL